MFDQDIRLARDRYGMKPSNSEEYAWLPYGTLQFRSGGSISAKSNDVWQTLYKTKSYVDGLAEIRTCLCWSRHHWIGLLPAFGYGQQMPL